ncbi:hypothetical protein FHX15_004700 [Rhizobium sp. BK650]|nr:hypothetical protein [Rhizobium sp. BK650]
MFGERGFRSLINLMKSLWKGTSTELPQGQGSEPPVTPTYVPQAYPDGFSFGSGKAVSDRPSEIENAENERS